MSHEKIASQFDRWVDGGRADSLEEHHRDVVSQVLEHVPVGAGQRVLDLGCGNGWATRLFGRAAPGSQGVGIDVSARMIARAEEIHQHTIRARYEVGTFEELGFRDESFDRVFSMEALYYAVDLDRALAEAYRVLKPGGRIDVIVDFYEERPATKGWQDSIDVHMHFLSEQEWRERMERAGFRNVRLDRVVDSRGPGDPERFQPDEWHRSWEDKVRTHEAGSLWISGEK